MFLVILYRIAEILQEILQDYPILGNIVVGVIVTTYYVGAWYALTVLFFDQTVEEATNNLLVWVGIYCICAFIKIIEYIDQHEYWFYRNISKKLSTLKTNYQISNIRIEKTSTGRTIKFNVSGIEYCFKRKIYDNSEYYTLCTTSNRLSYYPTTYSDTRKTIEQNITHWFIVNIFYLQKDIVADQLYH